MRKKRPPTQTIALTWEQEQQLLAAAKTPRQNLICRLLLETGCRLVELHRLNCNDLKHENGIYGLAVLGKGCKEKRFVPISMELYNLCLQACNSHKLNCLLPGYKNKCLSTRQLENILQELFSLAGIVGHIPHDLRNTVAVRMLENGHDIKEVQAKLRHLDVKTTLHYARQFFNPIIASTPDAPPLRLWNWRQILFKLLRYFI